MARPDVKEAWAKQGANPMTMTPPEFDKYLRADIEKWAKVVSARAGADEVRLKRRPRNGATLMAECRPMPRTATDGSNRYRHSSTDTVLRYFAPMMRQ